MKKKYCKKSPKVLKGYMYMKHWLLVQSSLVPLQVICNVPLATEKAKAIITNSCI